MRQNKPEVVIVMARCSHESGPFGIRFEKKDGNIWLGDWAFTINEYSARKEKYDHNVISGSIDLDPHYPGCPFCKSMAIVRCGKCNKVSCYDGQSSITTCPWCKNKARIGGIIDHLDAGGDR